MNEGKRRPGRHPVFGAVAWMTGTLTSFMLMALAGRELSTEFDTFQILFTRSFVGLVAISAVLCFVGWRHVRTIKLPMHLGRNAVHMAGQFGWFYGLAVIPIAQVFAIEFTTPMWTLLIAFLFIGERITVVRILAVVLGFIGILTILRPGIETVQVAQLAVVWAAIGYASTYVLTKRLTDTDRPETIMFWMTVIQAPLAALVPTVLGAVGLLGGLGVPPTQWAWPSAELWPWAILVGISGLCAHYCLSRALKLADASIVVPLDFLRLPISAVIGYLAYEEVIDWYVLAGALIIFSGTFINVRAESRT